MLARHSDSRGTRIVAIAAATLAITLVLSMAPAAVGVGSQGIGPGIAPGPGIGSLPPTESSATQLQNLVDNAVAGSTIHFPAGRFIGQLRIDKDLNLVGAGEGKTIFQSPSKMTTDTLGNVFVVEVGNHASVRISELTLRVTSQCMLSNSIGVPTGGGIGVGGNSTLRVWDINFVAFGPSSNLGSACTTHGNPGTVSFGRGLSVGLDDGPGIGTALQVEGHGLVEHVDLHGFDVFSISVGGVRGPSGSTATIQNNTVVVGPGPLTAAYGIVVYGVSVVSGNLVIGEPGSDGGIAVVFTSAIVTNNVVKNFTCGSIPFPVTPSCGVDPFFDDQDLGIFLAGITSGTIVQHNSIRHTDAGIFVDGPGIPAQIMHNAITNSTYYGLDLINANQTFRDDIVSGALYAIAVGAENWNTHAALLGCSLGGFAIGTALLEANYPFVAKLAIR
jgi:hypothetical protein